MKTNNLSIMLFVSVLTISCDNSIPGANPTTNEQATSNPPSASQSTAIVKQDDPVSVVNQVFSAAQSGNYSALTGLCDPEGQGDGDTKNICNMSNAPSADQEEFKKYFAKGEVVGAAEISGTEASVKIKFGPSGTDDEVMKLVNRNGKWYLLSF